MILTEIILFAFFAFAVIAAANFIGKFLAPLIAGASYGRLYYNFFLETILGLVAVVTLYSWVCTTFATINTGFVILLVALSWTNRNYANYLKDLRQSLRNVNYKVYLNILLLCILISFIAVIYPLSEGIENDVLFYVKIAEDLGVSGRENFFHQYNSMVSEFSGTSPYHYFELWLGAILFKIFGSLFTNVIIFKYICYAILKTVAVAGLIALIEYFKRKITLFDIVIAGTLCIFNLLYITEIGSNSWILYHDIWLRPNIAVYVMFLALFFNSILEQKYPNAILFVLFLPVASIVSAPAVLVGVVGFSVFLFIGKKIGMRDLIFLLISMFLIALFIFLFYQATSVSPDSLATDNNSLTDLLKRSLSMIKAIIFFVCSLSFRALLMLMFPLLFVVLLLRNWKDVIGQNLWMSIAAWFIAFSGILAFQFFPFIDNTYQFPYVGYAACLMSVLVLFYQMLLHVDHSRNKIVLLSFLLLFFGLNIMNVSGRMKFDLSASSIRDLELRRKGLDPDYIGKIEHAFSGSNDRMGGFILTQKELGKLYPGRRHTLTYQPGSYLAYFRSNFYLVSLTSPDTLYDADFKQDKFYQKAYGFNSLTPFYRNYSSDDYLKQLEAYIRTNRIRFLMVSGDFPLSAFASLNIREAVTDPSGAGKFIILE